MTEKVEKKVSIAAFTKNGREKQLEQKKKKGEKKGWEFVKYHEAGLNSFAIFMVPKSNFKRNSLIAIVLFIVFLIYLGSTNENSGSSSDVMYNISMSNINVRQNPAADSAVIGSLVPNQSVRASDSVNPNWKKVVYENKTGYVATRLLGIEKNEKFEEAKKNAEEKECRKKLGCWAEKFTTTAAVYCPEHIEKLANYTHEWTDGILDTKFTHYRWKNKSNGIVTYIGDNLKFQNGFGAWQNIVYECDIDTMNEIVMSVRAKPGRI